METYNFKLAPAYCLYNGVAVEKQKGAWIKFLIENPENDILKGRLERAFSNYLEFVVRQSDCPEIYKRIKHVEYESCNHKQLRKYVTSLYEVSGSKENEKNEKDEIGVKINQDAAAVMLLDEILFQAREKGATDIHIEKNGIRFRVKGILETQMELQEQRVIELVQRIKLLGGLNVMESWKSQDGHFVYGEENPIFVRVSTMPIVGKDCLIGSESVVLRLLDNSRIPLCLNQLGFNENQIERIQELKSHKNGLILICGPTGSGKSTTAGAILMEIIKAQNGKLKIISLEDPPEYVIPGVTQIKIDETKDNSFEDALTHIFRQDPDVIMIGEIRDKKSAETAIKASLTGHLVIATVHTSSAGGSLLRMENLEIEQKIIASVLRGVIVQELDFVDEATVLLGDVAIPKEEFYEKYVSGKKSEGELDELFNHLVNGHETLRKLYAIRKKMNIFLPAPKEDFEIGKEA